MRAVAFLLALPLLAQAQHAGHQVPARVGALVPKAQDPDKRAHWPAGAAITPAPGETMDHASMHALPIGTGAAPDGGAWLRPDVTGLYVIHNAKVLGLTTSPALLVAGRIYRVMPHKGPLVWTLPGGKREAVPNRNLIPPMPGAIYPK